MAIALSGGVDSAVAASLLIEAGHEVIGLTMPVWAEGGDATEEAPLHDAQLVADHLRIPLHVVDARASFKAHVIDYFISEYGAGCTPNPCVICNQWIKFGLLLDEARALGATHLATGHYARIQRHGDRWQLLRGRDRQKDQSYFLHRLDQRKLAQASFPLGALTKSRVCELANRRQIPTAGRSESQDICFLAGNDYRRFLMKHAPGLFVPGPIRDRTGHVLGHHPGLPGFTVGQRKGLGISHREPLYVLALNHKENALIVGGQDELWQSTCRIADCHYISGTPPRRPRQILAQIRYRADPQPAVFSPLGDQQGLVEFAGRQSGVTPGQFLVLYDDARVIGGGVICQSKEA